MIRWVYKEAIMTKLKPIDPIVKNPDFWQRD